jgi:hypothetical protein
MNFHLLSNEELHQQIKNLVAQERATLIDVLKHLREIDRRMFYAKIGYSSLWAYCTQELKYSGGAAYRRIEAMRALRDCPQIESKIESGSLNITSIAKVQTFIRKEKFKNRAKTNDQNAAAESKTSANETKLDLFTQLENKSQREADLKLAQIFPLEVLSHETIRPISANLFEIKFTVDSSLMRKIEIVQTAISNKTIYPSISVLLNELTDFYISKNKYVGRRAEPEVEHELRQFN